VRSLFIAQKDGVRRSGEPLEHGRVDRWLWAIRLFKSRSEATDACRSGHVRINGRAAKPSSTISLGDRVEANAHGRQREFEVTRVIDARVGAPIAVECYVDHSPPPPPRDPLFDRLPGAGRPTKRDRRQLDRWRGAG
jgi:ribosome-associated heat shock protein Hsp15